MYYSLDILKLSPADIYDMDIGFILDLLQTKMNIQKCSKDKSEEENKTKIRDATQADIDRL